MLGLLMPKWGFLLERFWKQLHDLFYGTSNNAGIFIEKVSLFIRTFLEVVTRFILRHIEQFWVI